MAESVSTPSHRALVGDALDVLFEALGPFVEAQMQDVYGEKWVQEARRNLHNKPQERWDVSDLLTLIYFRYAHAFSDLGHQGRSWVSLIKETRKRWAHQIDLSATETRRTLERCVLLLEAMGAEEEAARVRPHVHRLLREEVTNLPESEALEEQPHPVSRLMQSSVERVRSWWTDDAMNPLDLRNNVLKAVEQAVHVHRHRFLFQRLTVHVHTPHQRIRDRYEAALSLREESFDRAVRRCLADLGIVVENPLRVSWSLHDRVPRRLASALEREPIYIELDQRPRPQTATLRVLHHPEDLRFRVRGPEGVTIGRISDVCDLHGRLVRRNAISFDEPADCPDFQARLETVSRVHARLGYDVEGGVYVLNDEQSTWGTTLVRQAATVPVHVGRRPVPLLHGDTIYVGTVGLSFELGRRRGGGSRRS